MSYFYRAKTDKQLEEIANQILARFPQRRQSMSVDIEGILEDLGLDLLPRRGLKPKAEGFRT